jgi:hypothetical protein
MYWRNVGKKEGKAEIEKQVNIQKQNAAEFDKQFWARQEALASKVTHCAKCRMLLNVATKKCLVCDSKASS